MIANLFYINQLQCMDFGQLGRVLGLKNLDLVKRLVSTKYLESELTQILQSHLPACDEDKLSVVGSAIMAASLDRIQILSRRAAVLLAAEVVLNMTRGSDWRELAAWCDVENLLEWLRLKPEYRIIKLKIPVDLGLPVRDLYSGYIFRHIVGMLPPGYIEWFLMRLPDGVLGLRDVGIIHEVDRESFDGILQHSLKADVGCKMK
ncbi:hypothetical protein [Brucella anthropi]|uniref:hypothetical protein n=1 Tax=Brucella anthropi TaxID=529 RepID=UPI00384FF85B